MGRPFEGLLVVELGDELGALAGKLMADGGATVVKVEPPGGAASRRFGPFVDDVEGPDRSLFFAYYNTSKQSLECDIGDARSAGRIAALFERADIVIDGLGPGALEAAGWPAARVRGTNRGLIHLTMTPFGVDGPWAHYKTGDLVALALSGLLYDCGYSDHTLPPTRPGGNQSFNTASHQAFMAVLTALVWRQQSALGQDIDIAVHDSCAITVEMSNLYWAYYRAILGRQTATHASIRETTPAWYKCADDRYVMGTFILHSPSAWEGIRRLLDDAGMLLDFDDPAYDDPGFRRRNQHLIVDRVAALAATMPAEEFFHLAQKAGNVCGVVRYPEDLLDEPQLEARAFWSDMEWGGRTVRFPGAPWRSTSWAFVPHPPPRLNEHDADLLEPVGG